MSAKGNGRKLWGETFLPLLVGTSTNTRALHREPKKYASWHNLICTTARPHLVHMRQQSHAPPLPLHPTPLRPYPDKSL
jgi:hypothetical protein